MIYYLLMCFFGLVLDLFAAVWIAPNEKDLQFILLRQQLRILERRLPTQPRLTRPEKLMLVTLFTRLQRQTQGWYDRLQATLRLFKPDTLLKWHRDLVHRKWTFTSTVVDDRASMRSWKHWWSNWLRRISAWAMN